ncbi:hypothetical protein PVL29_009477 [Vitis rotundifolia]|uniref:Late embryogenesis abundant protein LEA-2 subgroup domain-containing protein n=1 Tax=Vitis rotundifolia TaxID=103349 RepID=A0AA38ZRB5_VITRO|nr:hypothetical protein PVL29_009477 [Vitis rotundifolia]
MADVTSKPGNPLLSTMDGITTASAKSKSVKSSSSGRRRTKAICITVGIVLLVVVVVMVILGFTVFKAKDPVITVGSVSLKDFNFSVDSKPKVNINVSLDVNVSVRNPNRVGFRYNNASALLNYDGSLVGEAPIPAGRIGARKTTGMNITISLMADRLLSNPQLYSDVLSGSLPLSTYARISGKVSVLFVKIKVVSTSTCNLTVDTYKRTLKDTVCQYKTKL